ncbi:DUF2142 domain-containing protein [Mycetocola sp. 2940]|uniref:DUF2142 domain-containing protein n=1 Tax=Mycetocola sp. 2940 TaxID=3156452 RepID=UPI0033999928
MTDQASIRNENHPRRWRDFLVAAVLFGVLAGIWALATPMTAVPDEPPHAIRAAAVVRGQIVMPISEAHPSESVAFVPRYIAHVTALRCFAFDPVKDASCQPPLAGDPDQIVETRTSSGPNSPFYYAVIGAPTLVLSGTPALYAMRAMNVALCAVLVGFLFMGVRQFRPNGALLVAAVTSLTPMVFFLSGSMNPNAVEALAAGALLVTLVLALRTRSSRGMLWERGAICVGSVLLLVNTRSISLLWLGIVLLVALLLARRPVLETLRRQPAAWLTLLGCAAAGCAAVVWQLIPKPSGQAVELAGRGQTFADGFTSMMNATFDFGTGWIGLFGWLDRPAPAFTVVVWTIAIGIVVVAGLSLATGAHRIVIVTLVVLAVLIPPIVQGALVTEFGYIWQGRYMLAVYTCLLLACGLAIDDRAGENVVAPARRIGIVLIVLMSCAHAASFLAVLRSYVVGAGSWSDMIGAPHWQPPLGWVPLTIAFLLVLTATTAVAVRSLPRTSANLPLLQPH